MKGWSDSFHQELRETLHPGQQDLFGALEIHPPFRPGVRCKKCALAWNGEDARQSLPAAQRRGCWWVTNKTARCPNCVKESE